MLATDAEFGQKKARAAVNPLAGLRLASALAAAWCCEETKIGSVGKRVIARPLLCIRFGHTSSASGVFSEDEMVATIARRAGSAVARVDHEARNRDR